MPAGLAQRYTAIGTYSDGTTQDISASVARASRDTTKATIDATGLASALAVGAPHLFASSAGVESNDAVLTVTAARIQSIAVTPTNASIAAGTTRQLTAIATYADGTTQNVTASSAWSSTATGVATVSSSGLVTGVTAGSADIRSKVGAVASNTAAVTVTAPVVTGLAITPPTSSQIIASGQEYLAIASFSDGTTPDVTSLASWVSNNTAVATIDAAGLATAVSGGSASIRATFGGTPSNAATLTVTTTVQSTGALNFARYFHHGLLLADGTALVAGGLGTFSMVDVGPAETYDPATGVWTTTGSMVYPRHDFTMVRTSRGGSLAMGAHRAVSCRASSNATTRSRASGPHGRACRSPAMNRRAFCFTTNGSS